MSYDINRVLEYLDKFHERKEIEEQFDISNQRSWRLVVWLKKLDLVEELNAKVEGRNSKKTIFYRRRK